MSTLVFDAVGTLIRPVESISAVYQRHAQEFGIKLSRATVKSRFTAGRQRYFPNQAACESSHELEKRRWKSLVQFIFAEFSPPADLFDGLWNYYAKVENWQMFDDSAEAIQIATRKFDAIAIGSNFDLRLLDICKALPVISDIEYVFCSAEIGSSKPDIRFFHYVERALNRSTPQKPVMVGDDAVKDVTAAQLAGWQSFLIDRSKESLVELVERI